MLRLRDSTAWKLRSVVADWEGVNSWAALSRMIKFMQWHVTYNNWLSPHLTQVYLQVKAVFLSEPDFMKAWSNSRENPGGDRLDNDNDSLEDEDPRLEGWWKKCMAKPELGKAIRVLRDNLERLSEQLLKPSTMLARRVWKTSSERRSIEVFVLEANAVRLGRLRVILDDPQGGVVDVLRAREDTSHPGGDGDDEELSWRSLTPVLTELWTQMAKETPTWSNPWSPPSHIQRAFE